MKKFFKPVIIISICILVEFLISNYSALFIKLGGYESAELNIESAVLSKSNDSDILEVKEGCILVDKGRIRFEDVNSEIKNVCIEVESDIYNYLNVELSFTDENFAYEEGFDNNRSTFQLYFEKNYKNYITHSSYGDVKTLELNFADKAADPFKILSVTINSPPAFHFSIFRLAVLIFVCLSIFYGAWKWKITKADYILIMLNTFLICMSVIILAVSSANLLGEPLLDPYPLENTYTDDQYEQLFSSFNNGRLNIEADADKKKLESLTNPYDISERDDAEIDGDYWDRAYYKGNFYSYFGVAPVFTVYYPVYFLTHQLPDPILALAILTVFGVIFLTLLYIQMLKRFCTDIPLLAAVLGHLSLIFGSALLAMSTERIFYYIAVISGIGWTAAFLYFILKAYFENKIKLRVLFLIFSGISAVMIAASRPGMLLYCTAALVPAVYILRSKEEPVKSKIIYICSIGVPLLIGALGIMTYNYLRFDSPFEFGFNYQLTVSMAAANNITPEYIPAALYHYFFQLPNIKSQFPYMELNYTSFSAYPRYTYFSANIGIFAYPVTWGLFLFPMTDKKKNKFKSFFLLSLFLSALVLAFSDMCKAGVHYRYTTDILSPMILVAVITLLDILYMVRNTPKRIYCSVYVLTVIAMTATIVIGYLLMFANENAYFITDYALITQILRNI